ncbi:MAG: glycoside hydrolase family 2 TIM barrel-domain containing protein [Rikenellaceae bacterium]
MKNITLYIAIMTLSIGATMANVTTSVREKLLFNDNWRFTQNDAPEQREFEFDDSSWRELTLPHDWSIEGEYTPDILSGRFNGYFPEGLGWYRKSFSVSAEEKNKQFVIEFEGVFMNSQVWINGQYLGNRPYGYSTFRYDITAFLKFDQENVIAVRVDNSIPGADRWYHGSGIYRDVYLLKTNYVHFKHNGGVYITTPVAAADKATVKVDYELFGSFFDDKEIATYKKNQWIRTENRWRNAPRDHECTIRSTIYNDQNIEVATVSTQHNIRNYDMNYTATQELSLENPNRWSAKSPNLYYMKSEIIYDGKVLDDVVTRFGVRDLDYRAGEGLFVNGEETKLWGVCLHHDAGSLGAAVPRKTLIYRLLKLKEMGCNAIRTAHNPFAPAFYELCDSMGFYVMDESFDEWRCGWNINWTENNTGKSFNGYNHLFDQWAETDLRDLVRRDRNHPSVIMYCIGNEIPDYRHFSDAGETAQKLYDIAKSEDPTRLISVGDNSSQTTNANGVQDVVNILGFNYIERDFGEAMYSEINTIRPEKLTFGSEVNKEIRYHLAVRDNKYVIGGFIWTGIDYLGETRDPKLRGWNTSLLDMTLSKRADGALYEVCWSDEPKVFITTTDVSTSEPEDFIVSKDAGERIVLSRDRLFTWNKQSGQDVYVVVYSNCDEVELKLNGKSLGRKANDWSQYFVEFKVPFKDGKLEAVGYKNGKKVALNALESTGEVSKIKATPVWNTLNRDDQDVAILEVDLVDKRGRRVPEATNLVNVEVEGGARLLGVDSPNLYYLGNFKSSSREAQNGKLLVTIISNGKDLPTKVTLTSDGVESCVVEF